MKKYIIGNTVRCTIIFSDFTGEKVDPALVKFITYDKNYNMINEVSIGTENKTATGEYFYDFVVPDKEGIMYYEWYGEIDGKPSISRQQISKTFI